MVLTENETIWRRSRANRAAVLNDAASYFGALRQSLLAARHSVFIIGWDLHSQTRLVGPSGRADDGLPECLGEFLEALVERRPSLKIHVLVWSSPVIYAGEREWFPAMKFSRGDAGGVHFCLDNCLPIGSAQHQKLVLVDDCIAYSGGLDITIRRWDTSEHAATHPQRCDPEGKSYPPFHDVQMVVDGDAARSLAELGRYRWACAKCSIEMDAAPAGDASGDCWPAGVTPDFRGVNIGIARTEPAQDGKDEIAEVERLFFASIAAAEHSIYIENQFLSSVETAECIVKRMLERPELEVLLIAPKAHESWIEKTMRNGRLDFLKIFTDAGVQDRMRLLYPEVTDGRATEAVMIHSKVMIVDDRILRVGSANLNNRSLGVDTECDLVIEAENDEQRRAILCVRDSLIAHHCGSDLATVQARLAKNRSLLTLATTLAENGHSLMPVVDGERDPEELVSVVRPIADPRYPLGLESAAASAFDRSLMLKLAVVATLLCIAALAWRFTPLYGLTDFEVLRGAIGSLNGNPLAPAIVVVIFVLGGFILFPVILLIAATAAALGPWLGLGSAIIGVLTSASIVFAIGRLVGKKPLQALLGPRLERVQEKIVGNGIVAVALVRMLPVAPFSIVNIVAGAGGIRFVDFVVGTILGMSPGLIAMSVFGAQIADVLEEPTWWGVGILAVCLVAWLAFSVGAQIAVTWFMNRHKGAAKTTAKGTR